MKRSTLRTKSRVIVLSKVGDAIKTINIKCHMILENFFNRNHTRTTFQKKGKLTMSYKKLTIRQNARQLSIDIHRMTLEKLTEFELFEVGSQIRRSSKSTRSTIDARIQAKK
ncbi:MAG: four helix bundle protein [Chitinivibrionales bacterium]|nr:four helix bundle protein [Chitinivibrionales bacterium]